MAKMKARYVATVVVGFDLDGEKYGDDTFQALEDVVTGDVLRDIIRESLLKGGFERVGKSTARVEVTSTYADAYKVEDE